MKILVFLAIAASLMGCASNPASRTSVVAWQAMNVVDMGQTLHIARTPECYRESNFLTKKLIGSHPSEKEVILVSAAYAVGHALVSRWLDRRTDEAFANDSPNRGAWYVGRIAFHGAMLGSKAWQINHNNSIGLKPFGKGCSK